MMRSLIIVYYILSGTVFLLPGRIAAQNILRKTPLPVVDQKVSSQTLALFNNLKQIAGKTILFGHQEDTRLGYGWMIEQRQQVGQGRSDVKDLTGTYPAVYGWDLQYVTNEDTTGWNRFVSEVTRSLAIEAYNRGGVNTFSWHLRNPVSKGGVQWKESPVEAVSLILPGAPFHELFRQDLNKVAAYLKSLVTEDGQSIPVIFRPFHEMNGDWFWWGKGHCTVQQYRQLYRFTITYLRDTMNAHNLLYAWSPDRDFRTEEGYLQYYPGDAFTDILGLDDYGDMVPGNGVVAAAAKLKIVSACAMKRNKVAALTETGSENLRQPGWYTQTLLPLLHRLGVQLAYAMVWSNSAEVFWTPYKGHREANDFNRFRKSPFVLFGDEVPQMYKNKKGQFKDKRIK